MAKYLLLWELDPTKVPVNPRERAAAWKPMMEMVKQEMEDGVTKDWGGFVGELRGYSVVEGTEVEIGVMVQKYVPYVHFEVHPVGSVEQVEEIIKELDSMG